MLSSKNYNLKLVHIYPKLLNIYGDIGNILTFKKRCEWYGIDLEVIEYNGGDCIEIGDLYFIGGGQDSQQIEASKELLRHKNFLRDEVEKLKVFLGICAGYQLMGNYYETSNRETINGLEIFNAYTTAGEKRSIGNVTAHCDFLEPKTLVGFENHRGQTHIMGKTTPLAMLEIGCGNNGVDKTEGARYKNAFGTYLHGSLLPKNPHFADYMLQCALNNRYESDIRLSGLNDEIEFAAHNSVVNKKY